MFDVVVEQTRQGKHAIGVVVVGQVRQRTNAQKLIKYLFGVVVGQTRQGRKETQRKK